MTFTIDVTDEDIRNGKKTDCYNCPIALAIKRAFDGSGYTLSAVSSYQIGFYISKGLFNNAPLEPRVTNFIRGFDTDGFMGNKISQPFSFELEV